MISIIICSVSPRLLKELEENIAQTIGVEYEIVAVDNREKGWPIAKAYNYGAQQAKYPYLFFVHEDVKLLSNQWGNFIIPKLMEPDCGVVGFVGDKLRLACCGGWFQHCYKSTVSYFYQRMKEGGTLFLVENAYLDQPFQEVISLDGLGFFVRREIWAKYPFDEKLLTGFHCYDIDFSLQIASANYKNYVCCSNQMLIEHFSQGNFNDINWFSTTLRLHEKWKDLLPMKASDLVISEKYSRKCEERTAYDFLKQILVSKCDISLKRTAFRIFLRRPFSRKHLKNCISAIIKYVRYA